MKKLLLILLLLVPSVTLAGTVQYALVRDGEIFKRMSVDEADALKIQKMVAHSYVLITKQAVPAYDSRVESIVESEVITGSGVVKTYTVKAIDLNTAKAWMIRRVDEIAANRIKDVFDDGNRNTKILNILNKRDGIIDSIKAATSIEALKIIKEELT